MKVVVTIAMCLFGLLGAQVHAHQSKVPACLPALALYLQQQEHLLQQVDKKLKITQQEIQQVKQSVGKWPAGSYCILASGGCPPGFTRKSGHLRALNMYSHTTSYITPVHFGSSRIQCHGKCGQYGNWVGDLFIAACCK